MTNESEKLEKLVCQLREAFARGENAMALARRILGCNENDPVATLLSYDLQTGGYVRWAKSDLPAWETWCAQLANLLRDLLPASGSLLEVGCGECMTMCGVLRNLPGAAQRAFGFDISWSRVDEGRRWLGEWSQTANLFVGNLFKIPLADNSIDVVYSSHSLEPNGGREEEAIRECLRVARKHLVLVEPIFELAGEAQRLRMAEHGYIRGLYDAACKTGAYIRDYRLLDFSLNPMNPSGIIVLDKQSQANESASMWQCPLSGMPLREAQDAFICDSLGLVYPVLRRIPMLRAEHAIVASRLR